MLNSAVTMYLFPLVILDMPSLPACGFLHAHSDVLPHLLPSLPPPICQATTLPCLLS